MIDREKTICDLETIGAWHTHHYEPFHYECAETIHNALELLKEQEAVVRCKDCKYLDINRCTNDRVLCQIDDCGCCPTFYVTDEWFCADGERR